MKISEDLIVTPTLLRRFEAEAAFEGGDGRHYAVIRRDDGGTLAHNPGSPELAPEQLFWGQDVLRALNRELHHDGAWVLVFTNPIPIDYTVGRRTPVSMDITSAEYGRYCLIWLDRDGDPQFSIEWAKGESALRDFADVMLAGINSTLAKCESAWATWKLMMRDVLEPREDQLFKAAQGQRAPSTRH